MHDPKSQNYGSVTSGQTKCDTCGGSGRRATACSAKGRGLEHHERRGTPCDSCKGTGLKPKDSGRGTTDESRKG